ncbi:MAG: phytanoyl-CoA dioxygenase family protein [Xanthomonadales bacterium]|nr:phytanoyl-CoA dioxygenase family protein [Xanthomonadales bacterium]
MTDMAAPAADHDLAKQFADQGFLVCEHLLGPEEIDELKADLVRLARGEYPCGSLAPLPADIPDDEAMNRILCIHMPHFVSPLVRRYTTHPRIAEILGRVVGAHLKEGHWDGGVKCMQSMFFAKPPGKPGQAWHQDEVYIPTRDRSLCGAWIAIDDANVDNGCLWVLPGSHKAGVLFPQKDHGRPDEFDVSPESYGFDDSAELPVEVPAGSVVFFNGYLLHRSKKNVSGGYRRALVNHYMSTQSFLPWFVEDAENVGIARADHRAVHVVTGKDPYKESGYVVPEDAVWLRQYQEQPVTQQQD